MKKKIFFTVFIAIFAVGLNYSLAGAFGTPDGMGRGMRDCNMTMQDQRHRMGTMFKERPMWRYIMGLGLDDKQVSEIRDIRDRTIKETIRKRADVQVGRVELRELINTDPVDMKKVEAKLRTIEGLRTEVRLLHFKALEEVKAKLTPEQKTKLKEFMETGPMMRPGRMTGMRNGDKPWFR